MVTPRGVFATRRLPASGAGPAPDRLVLGSEGTLGIVTEAWMRVRPRPRFRASASVRFAGLRRGGAGRAGDRAERPLSVELPPARSARGDAQRRPGRRRRGAAARVRVGGAVDARRGSTARSRSRSAHGGTCAGAEGEGRRARRRRERGGVAAGVLRRAVPAERAREPRRHRRHLRDGVHVGPLRGAARRASAPTSRRRCSAPAAAASSRAASRTSTPTAPRPYFTFVAPGRAGEEIAQWEVHQARRGRRPRGERRHDHAPPRRRTPASPLVRDGGAGALRRGAPRGEEDARSRRAS